jgi:hypothetical protein
VSGEGILACAPRFPGLPYPPVQHVLSLTPKSAVAWRTGFSCGYTSRSLSFVPIFPPLSVISPAYLYARRMGKVQVTKKSFLKKKPLDIMLDLANDVPQN